MSGNTCSEVCVTNFRVVSQSKLIILSIADSSFGGISNVQKKITGPWIQHNWEGVQLAQARSPWFDLQHQLKLDLVVNAHNPSTYAVEAGGSKVQDSS